MFCEKGNASNMLGLNIHTVSSNSEPINKAVSVYNESSTGYLFNRSFGKLVFLLNLQTKRILTFCSLGGTIF